MNETKFGRILENACRLAGRDISTGLAVPTGWRILAAMAVNGGVRTLAAEKFPMLQRVEFRRYRPYWDVYGTYEQGHEVWYESDYWRLEAEISNGLAPDVSGSGWRKLESGEVCAFINWCQPWARTMIDTGGVDATRFAYAADPRLNPHATPLKVVGISDLGIELAAPAPNGVYIRFVPVFPAVAFDEWTSGTQYAAGEAAYLTATKDVYIAARDLTGSTETTTPPNEDVTGAWQTVRIASEFEPYLTRLCAADLLTEDQGKFQTRAAADREFEALCERYHEGNGETRIRRGRFY